VILITSALPRMPSLPVVRGEIKRAALEARVVQFVTNEWNHTAYVMGRPKQLTAFGFACRRWRVIAAARDKKRK
jgi:hypothetical protein